LDRLVVANRLAKLESFPRIFNRILQWRSGYTQSLWSYSQTSTVQRNHCSFKAFVQFT